MQIPVRAELFSGHACVELVQAPCSAGMGPVYLPDPRGQYNVLRVVLNAVLVRRSGTGLRVEQSLQAGHAAPFSGGLPGTAQGLGSSSASPLHVFRATASHPETPRTLCCCFRRPHCRLASLHFLSTAWSCCMSWQPRKTQVGCFSTSPGSQVETCSIRLTSLQLPHEAATELSSLSVFLLTVDATALQAVLHVPCKMQK